jgi:N6-L-threonylcarbamoyladenine synthase
MSELILGIDTSCDDTSASIVEGGTRIVSNIVSSQAVIHRKYGGVVPEIASRRHMEMIWPVVDEALKSAALSLDDLAGIAVCYGPGLIGSLLVGCSFAKAVAYSKNIPFIGVNHLEGHIFSAFLLERRPYYPFIALIVSGGHTVLIEVEAFGRYREIGRTRDDAAGEAYDKVAKLLGLGYPGGPVIDALAEKGNPESIGFPRPLIHDGYDFSFSGLKTAVRNHIHQHGCESAGQREIEDICASFQRAVVDVLVIKTERLLKERGIRSLVISGGVAANRELRSFMVSMAEENNVALFIPPPELCTDNAAMIAASGYRHLKSGRISGMDLAPKAYLPL